MLSKDYQAEELLLEKLLQDDEFQELETLSEPFNAFEVLDAAYHEIRHSNVLAWLLNPTANHGLGDQFLKTFLWKTTALARERGIGTIRPLEVDSLDLSNPH